VTRLDESGARAVCRRFEHEARIRTSAARWRDFRPRAVRVAAFPMQTSPG
jgi:hypothetical protein